MIPIRFDQANKMFGPPPDLTDEQCKIIHAYTGTVEKGSCEGARIVVTAWQPNERELADLVAGKPVFLTCLHGLPPHYLTTNFEEATSVA